MIKKYERVEKNVKWNVRGQFQDKFLGISMALFGVNR
jgi:hypothetical protein